METSVKRLLLAFGLLFALGIILATSNAYCAVNMGHVFAPLLFGIALVALATGGSIVLLFQWKINNIQLKKLMSILPIDEGKLLKIIIEKKSISQTELRYLSGLSRVKVSRIISVFEQRGIIKKKPYGNTNLIISRLSKQ